MSDVNWWHVGFAATAGFFIGAVVAYTTTVFVLFKDWMR